MTGDAVWQSLGDLPAWEITEIPRRPPSEGRDGPGAERRDLGAMQRVQALVSAYHRGSPVAVGWVRPEPGGPVRMLAAGAAVAGGDDGGQVVLTLPAGARGYPLPAGQASAVMAGMPCWVRLAGITDVLLADRGEPGLTGQTTQDEPPSLEDGLLSAWLGPFAWLVLAKPFSGEPLEELTSRFSLAQLNAQHSDSPRSQLAARRAAARHVELRQAAATGLWQIHILAGAATASAATQVAGLLCSSADLTGLPYALVPLPGCGPLPALLDGAGYRHGDQDGVAFRSSKPRTRDAHGGLGSRMPYPAPGVADHRPALERHGADDPAQPKPATRVPAIASRVSGPALASHVIASMRQGIADGSWRSCNLDEPEYLAPPYQWTAVLDDLREYCANHPAADRHPSSDAWEIGYNRPIPGSTCTEQLEAVQRWHEVAQRDHGLAHTVLYGIRQPSAIETAVGARTTDPDWPQRLTDALGAFRDCRWPIGLLPATAGPT